MNSKKWHKHKNGIWHKVNSRKTKKETFIREELGEPFIEKKE